MLEGLNELVGLSQLDSKIAALEEELAALPARRQAAAEQRAAGEERLSAARERVGEAEQSQRRCEAEAQDKEALKARLESQQHQVKTNEAYTALLHEIDQAGEAISDAETGVLEAMEAIELARADLGRLEEQLRGVNERLDAEEKERSGREQALRAELEQLRTRRAEQVGALDPALMSRYDKVAARRRPAVAVISGEICLGCRVDIPPQSFIEILKGEVLVTCNHCHRILIHRDQLEAAGG